MRRSTAGVEHAFPRGWGQCEPDEASACLVLGDVPTRLDFTFVSDWIARSPAARRRAPASLALQCAAPVPSVCFTPPTHTFATTPDTDSFRLPLT
jgi:hypothetical protein